VTLQKALSMAAAVNAKLPVNQPARLPAVSPISLARTKKASNQLL